MATLAIISDVHGNFAALEAVVCDLEKVGCEGIYCLGDTVGYGGSPNQCVDLMRSWRAICVLGNHDAVASGLESPDDFNAVARAAADWTAEALTGENAAFRFADPASPTLVLDPGDPGVQYVLMPLRV